MNNNIENETNSIAQYQKIHFTIMAIEASAKKMNISGQEMYNRLKRQDLINQRLYISCPDMFIFLAEASIAIIVKCIF